jgi:RHS repeat-associated protein
VRDERYASGRFKSVLTFSGGLSVTETLMNEIHDFYEDPDQDGRTNFYEYAFGGDPLSGWTASNYTPPFPVSGYHEWAIASISARVSAQTIVNHRENSVILKGETIRGSDMGGGVGGVLYTLVNGQRQFNSYNSRGDVVNTSNDSGNSTWQGAYEALGTRTAERGSNPSRQRANTKDEDPTGLLNEGFRYRDLETGLFITRDPLGFVDGPNVYTYVRQNPWSGFDPDGLKEKKFQILEDKDVDNEWGKGTAKANRDEAGYQKLSNVSWAEDQTDYFDSMVAAMGYDPSSGNNPSNEGAKTAVTSNAIGDGQKHQYWEWKAENGNSVYLVPLSNYSGKTPYGWAAADTWNEAAGIIKQQVMAAPGGFWEAANIVVSEAAVNAKAIGALNFRKMSSLQTGGRALTPSNIPAKINVQKQNGHIAGTKQHTNRLKTTSKHTSTFFSRGEANALTLETYQNGDKLSDALRLKYFYKPVGIGPNGGGYQTQVRVSINGKGEIHGSPWGPVYEGPINQQ